MKTNTDVREAIEKSGLRYYEVAYAYGCNDGNFSRKLRREFSAEEKKKILSIIAELKKAGEQK